MQGFFGKILPEAKRRRGDFFENPKGADLAGQKGHGITFAKNLNHVCKEFHSYSI